MHQSPRYLVLVSPDHFGFNPETAESNAFQKKGESDEMAIRTNAKNEFLHFLSVLEKNRIQFKAFSSNSEITPDAVFPNNWFSVQPGGSLVLYPMLAVNRRKERNPEIISWLMEALGKFRLIDLTSQENENEFLEGTGSIVFHHPSRTAFACISSRTSEKVLSQLCSELNYSSCTFIATDQASKKIYHTNVMMTITENIAIICSESIKNIPERKMVLKKIESCGLEIIPITFSQMNSFAGNMFEVINRDGKKKLLMSETAFNSLSPEQISQISIYTEPVPCPVPVIEYNGGGSIRCMVAGVFFSDSHSM